MKNSRILSALLVGLICNIGLANSQKNQISQKEFNLPQITITITSLIAPECNGENNGQVSVEATGGKAPYTYNWNTFPNQYNATATGLKQGVYFVYVSDAEGNNAFKSIEMINPSESILTSKKMLSIDELDLTSTVNSTDLDLQYFLNEESIDSYMISELPVGVHKLVVQDSKQCVLTQYIQVFELKSKDKNEIAASVEFINQDGEKVLVSELIPDKKKSTGIIIKGKN